MFFREGLALVLKHKLIWKLIKKIGKRCSEVILSAEEEMVLAFVASSINMDTTRLLELPVTRESWSIFNDLIRRHQLSSLVAGSVGKAGVPAEYAEPILVEGKRVCLQYYRLSWETRALCDLLEKEGMAPVVYKGCAAASYYPVPELRKSGDIDICVGEEDAQRAADVLVRAGFLPEPGPAGSHHLCFRARCGYEIELHRHLTKPFNNKNVDGVLLKVEEAMGKQRRMVSALPGIDVPTMEEAEFAFSLVIHMVQHQLRGGFGLRLLADWVTFLNAEHETNQIERLSSYLEEAGLMRFMSVVVVCCERWLGLAHERSAGLRLVQVDDDTVEQFMRDVVSAGEFGESIDTALAAPEKATLGGFAREFHHQMLIRHPRASKVVPIWPALWANTFFQFVRNNRKLRHISTIDVLKTAAKRGKAVGGLKLFETERRSK